MGRTNTWVCELMCGLFYRVGRQLQGGFGRRFSFYDLSAGFGELGNEATAACGREREPNE